MVNHLKKNDKLVCVHTIEGEKEEGHEIPVPDMRSNKPVGVHQKDEGQTAFFQKLINANIGDKKISIAEPNEISLSLSISKKSRAVAADLKRKIIEIAKVSSDTLYSQEVRLAYDYLEEIQKTIVFSYKSVESFCNASIPEDYVYQKTNNKGIVESYGKRQIERWINTSEKVSSILPEILKIEDPQSMGFWSDFKNLERIRNEIIHSKSSNSSEILSELFSEKIEEYLTSSLKLLEFFILKDPFNQIFPLGFGVSQIRVVSLDDASQIFEKVK